MATAPENRNLLQLDELENAYGSSQLYVVYNGQDYRASLETLLSLITKTSLGLDKVDNTADTDKPVSTKTQQAITDAVQGLVGRAEFDNLVQTIQGFVSLETLNTAIANINTVLNTKLNQEQVLMLIGQALTPVQQAMLLMDESINSALTRIAALEARTSVTQEQLDVAIANVNQITDLKLQNLSNTVQASIQALSQSVDSRILLLTQSLNTLSQALDNKADKLHHHPVTEIENFEQEVRRVASEYIQEATDLVVGPNDW